LPAREICRLTRFGTHSRPMQGQPRASQVAYSSRQVAATLELWDLELWDI